MSLGELARRNEVWVFVTVLVCANALWATFIWLDLVHFLPVSYTRIAVLALSLVGVVYAFRGFRGVIELVLPMLEWRHHIGWYAFALFMAPVACAVCLFAYVVLAGGELERPGLNSYVFSSVTIMARIFVLAFVGEIVWVGYTARQLTARGHTPYAAALVVGFFWALWWLPYVFYGFGVVPGLTFPLLLVAQTGVAIMCTFLYYQTRSALLVLLMQATFNMTILVFPVIPPTGGVVMAWLFAVAYLVLGTALFAVFGPKPLFRNGTEVPVSVS
ncbi:hypothetical protein HKCCE3408_02040 [Rhodobacterales bacterium HKCCE3408]|nr:hypothetical protein [Rhodobacterales bacterium HKCCE3408]